MIALKLTAEKVDQALAFMGAAADKCGDIGAAEQLVDLRRDIAAQAATQIEAFEAGEPEPDDGESPGGTA